MADPDHLEKFNDTVFDWNSWRREKPDVVPDLSGGALSEISCLFERDLSRAILHHVDLSGRSVTADFRDAKAHGLVATNASFYNCKFDGCELSKPVVVRDRPAPNKFAIDAYGLRQSLLSPNTQGDSAGLRKVAGCDP